MPDAADVSRTPRDPPTIPPSTHSPEKMATKAKRRAKRSSAASIPRSKFANITAAIVLIVFVVLLVYMFLQVDETSEVRWTRILYLFGSVEAIAFAAAGYMFGREVSRGEIAKAEEQAEDAREEATQASEEARRAGATAALAQQKARTMLETAQRAASREPAPKRWATVQGADDVVDAASGAANEAVRELADTLEVIYRTR